MYTLFEPRLPIFVRPTAVVLAAVAGRDLEAVALVENAEVERPDRDILRREIDGVESARRRRRTQRFVGLRRSYLDRQLLTGDNTYIFIHHEW